MADPAAPPARGAAPMPTPGQLVWVGVTAGVSSVLTIALLGAAGMVFPPELNWRAWPQWALLSLVLGSIHRTCAQVLGWLMGPEP